jgi:hypothetical protein
MFIHANCNLQNFVFEEMEPTRCARIGFFSHSVSVPKNITDNILVTNN